MNEKSGYYEKGKNEGEILQGQQQQQQSGGYYQYPQGQQQQQAGGYYQYPQAQIQTPGQPSGYYQYPPQGQAGGYYQYPQQGGGQGQVYYNYDYPPQELPPYPYPNQISYPQDPNTPLPQDFPGPPPEEPHPETEDGEIRKKYYATAEQAEKFKGQIRNKFRANMPFDWLGQIDNQWYSSWLLTQPNFVAFRLGLAVFTYYCWRKFHGEMSGDTWNSLMESLLDSSTPTRFLFVWVSLFVVMIATGGMALISGLQLIMPKKKFARLTCFRLGLTWSGQWRSWLIFKINGFYDATPMMSCVPIVLQMVPTKFFVNKLQLPLWITLTLPLMVLMDLWITKRTRFDGTSVRRYTTAIIVILAIGCFLWTILHYLLIRLLLAFNDSNYYTSDLAPLLLFYWGYAVITTIGVDATYNFCRFKANYLLANELGNLAARDVNEIAKDYGEHYTKKKEELRARLEAEQAAAYEEWLKQMHDETGEHEVVEGEGELEGDGDGDGGEIASLDNSEN